MSSLVEKEILMQTFLIEKLTHIRESPHLIIDELESMITSLKNTKMETKAIAGIQKEIERLEDYQAQKELRFSEGLTRGAHKQIQNFLNQKDGDFTTFVNSSSQNLEPIMKNYVQSHGSLYQIMDTFSDENRFIQKLFMNMSPKGISSRKYLFDPKLEYFGVACKKYKNTFIVNIIFTNSVKDLAIYNLDDELAEKINDLRAKNNSIYEHYSAGYKKMLEAVPGFNAEQITKFFNFLKEKKKLNILKKEAVLDDLAYHILNHSSEKDDVELGNHIKEFVSTMASVLVNRIKKKAVHS
jgi:hypothetical protein